MRRAVVILLLSIAGISAFAQPKAIGMRIGGDAEFSYQHFLGRGLNFLEVDAGITAYKGLALTGAYDFTVCESCFNADGLNFYLGPAVQIGYFNKYDRPFGLGAGLQIGLEYCFPDLPLDLSLDYRPVWNFFASQGNWISAAVGVRYAF